MMYNINTEILKRFCAPESISLSLNGILPAFDEKRIVILPETADPGLCISVAKSSPLWKFISGCEALLDKLCLVVRSGVAKLRKKTAEKINLLYKRAKTPVLFSAPRFLRL